MPLSEISQIPQTLDDWKAWAFAHMANHRDICRIVNTAGSQGAITPSFTSIGGNDFDLSGATISNAGINYWQPATGAWNADATNCGWASSGAPTIAVSVSEGKIVGASFTPAASNPSMRYNTAAPNVGVTPGLTITAGTGNVLAEYPLYPIDLNYLGIWLYNHQTMHTQMDAVLGIAGYNLLELDWTQPGQLADWISFNVNEHIQACRILGIG